MKTHIIQIGNSRGVRLPKTLLEQAHLSDEVRLEATPNQIMIRSAHLPREGWEEAFRSMAQRGDDNAWPDEPVSLTSFDDAEWSW
jgi:antitoxin MazE